MGRKRLCKKFVSIEWKKRKNWIEIKSLHLKWIECISTKTAMTKKHLNNKNNNKSIVAAAAIIKYDIEKIPKIFSSKYSNIRKSEFNLESIKNILDFNGLAYWTVYGSSDGFLTFICWQSIAFYLQLFLLNNGLEISSDTFDYYAAAVAVVAAATMLYPSHI